MHRDQHGQLGVELLESQMMPMLTGLSPGEGLFAIGDVHGRSLAFATLLNRFQSTVDDHDRSCLILLGDLMDRGPDSIGALDLAITVTEEGPFHKCIPLMGNHEQLIRLVLRGCVDMDPYVWIWNDWGGTVLKSLGVPLPPDIFAWGDSKEIEAVNGNLAGQLKSALSQRRVDFLNGLKHHHFAENMLFVHAGIDSGTSLADHLGQPWDLLENNHWAWIRGKFIRDPNPHDGLTVIHGHTCVRKSRPRPLSHADFVPHCRSDGKINLDAGSFVSGCVAGAEFSAAGYRLFLACEER